MTKEELAENLVTESEKGANPEIVSTGEKKKAKLYGEGVGQLLIFITLLAMIILLPLGRIISDRVGLNGSMIIQSVFMMVIFGITLLLIAVEAINGRIDWKESRLVYGCLIVMWLFSFVQCFNAPIPKLAFIGNAYRGEGLLQIGAYYGIFVVTTLLVNTKYRKILLYAFFGVNSILSVFGIIQFLEISNLNTVFSGMACFGFGNPMFFTSVVLLFSGISMASYWLYKEDSTFFHPFSWWRRWVWLLLSGISYIGCIVTRCSAAYVGIIMLFLLMIFLAIVSKKKGFVHISILLLLFVVVMLVLNFASDGGAWNEFSKTYREIEDQGSVFGDNVGSGRMKIWKSMLDLLPLYWLTGCGIEQLGYVHLFVYGLTEHFQIVDNAHNEYLNLWLTEGIVVLALYLVFLFALFIPGVLQYIKKDKYESDDIKKVAFFAFFAYIAQAFFGIRTIAAAPYFWFICGLLFMKKRKSQEPEKVQVPDFGKDVTEGTEIQEKGIEKI